MASAMLRTSIAPQYPERSTMSHLDDHESKDELDLLRHSTAHVLAAAVTELWPGTKYAIGPPIEDGFYYDFDTEHHFTPEDFKEIEKKMRSIVGRNLPFEQEKLAKADAIETFKKLGQDYKVELIEDRVADGEEVSLYRT